MEKLRLSDIEGVGEKIRSRLIEFFGSEEEAVRAILEGRVSEVASAPGVGLGKAYSIVRSAWELVEGVKWDSVLKTEGVKRIYEDLLKLIQEYAQTEYAKNKLRLFWPYPASKIEKVMGRLEIFSEAKRVVEAASVETLERIRGALRRLKNFEKVTARKVKGRVIITRSEVEYAKLREAGVDKYCSVFLIGEGEKVKDYVEGYDLAVFVGDVGDEDYTDNLITVAGGWKIEDLVPETVILFYAENYRTVEAICDLADVVFTLPGAKHLDVLRGELNREALRRVRELIGKITVEGEVARGVDPELDRYRDALQKLNEAVAEVEAWVNETIRSRLAESEAKLRGEQIIRILEEARGATLEAGKLRSYLPPEVDEVITRTITEGEKRFCEALGVNEKELLWLEGVFPEEPALPVSMIPRKVSALESWLNRQRSVRKHKVLREVARELSGYMDAVRRGLRASLELDLYFAIGLFARDYCLNPPKMVDGVGVFFSDGVNVFLKKRELEGGERVVPVSYVVGDVGVRIDGAGGERIIVLSGANSGGKTTLIQLIAQVCILAQMGFPVPAAEAVVGPFEEIYFFEKSQGMVSAGALETTLKRFAAIASTGKPKIALFDELEAMTETGAAAVIIASLLDLLGTQERTCVVVVSHLAKEIISMAKSRIRVDGIEASGLDEKYDLIVNRSPRSNYLARSTPELILKRLYALSDGEEKKVFGEMLERLEALRG
ncbi:MAG: AAA family ATPase [Candidatus Jordarchaeales archaeon]